MNTVPPSRCRALLLGLIGLLLLLAGHQPLLAQTNITGPATVTGGSATGNLNVTGTIDSDGNTLTFGTQGGSYGMAMIYADSSTDTVKFSINRNPAAWLWVHNAAINAMRLDTAHQLILYRSDGTTAGLTLTPQTSAIKLGTHASATLTGNTSNGTITTGGALVATGALTASSGITNSNGNLTGGSTGLTLNAGGTNQNINLLPSGSGKVGIGTSSPASLLHLFGTSPNILIEGNGVTKAGLQLKTNGILRWDINSPSASSDLRVNNGTSDLLTVQNGGNVGIGTTSPQTTLHVNGAVTLGLAGSASGHIDTPEIMTFNIDSDNNAADTRYFGWYKNASSGGGTELMRLTEAGSVGIGTTNPAEKLEVVGGIKTSGATAGMSRLVLQSTAAGGQQYEWYNDYNGAGSGVLGLYNRTANNNPISFTSAGNVGIGTSTPGQLLDVNGQTRFRNTMNFGSADEVGTISWGTMGGGTGYGMRAGSGRALSLGTNGSWDQLVITPAGSVGIGTTNPGYKLEVSAGDTRNIYFNTSVYPKIGTTYGSGASIELYNGATGAMTFTSGSTSYPFIFSNGSVGIGTTTPDAPLHVFGGAAMTSSWNRTMTLQATYPVLAFNSNAAKLAGIGYDAGYAMRFWVNAATNDVPGSGLLGMSIMDSGSVGIGTGSPSEKLEVVGGIKTSGATAGMSRLVLQSTAAGGQQYEWYNDYNGAGSGVLGLYNRTANNNPISFTSAGNVGIGTTAPSAKLDVNGNLLLSGGRASFLTTGDNATTHRGGFQWLTWDNGLNNVFTPTDQGGLPRDGTIRFGGFSNFNSNTVNLAVSGNVGIGTTNVLPAHKLAVNGTIRAKEIIVDTGWADYVFDESYRLAPLAEVEQHIKEKKHLPGIPSAADVATQGVSLGDMQAKLLSKVEELTLHMIAQQKEIASLRQEVTQLKAAAQP